MNTRSARFAERTRGVTLRTLDPTSTLAAVPVGEDETASTAFDPWAVIEHGDHLDVINGEGVGWEVTVENPLPLPIYVSRPGFIAVVPRYEAVLDPDEVRELANGEEIDLADLVRVHNARLEDNFWIWHRHLTH